MIISMTVFMCGVGRLELYSFRRPGVVSGQHSLILFKSEYGYTVLGCSALHLKDSHISRNFENWSKRGRYSAQISGEFKGFFSRGG